MASFPAPTNPLWTFFFISQAKKEKEKVLKDEMQDYYEEWENVVQGQTIERCFDSDVFLPVKNNPQLKEVRFSWKGNQVRFFGKIDGYTFIVVHVCKKKKQTIPTSIKLAANRLKQYEKK